jgi:hypothetical protein
MISHNCPRARGIASGNAAAVGAKLEKVGRTKGTGKYRANLVQALLQRFFLTY